MICLMNKRNTVADWIHFPQILVDVLKRFHSIQPWFLSMLRFIQYWFFHPTLFPCPIISVGTASYLSIWRIHLYLCSDKSKYLGDSFFHLILVFALKNFELDIQSRRFINASRKISLASLYNCKVSSPLFVPVITLSVYMSSLIFFVVALFVSSRWCSTEALSKKGLI